MFYHEEDLLQPLNAVFIPRRADVHAARLTANKMFCQQHDETLCNETQTFFSLVYDLVPILTS